MVVPASHPLPRGGWYSRSDNEPDASPDGALTLCGGPSQGPSGRRQVAHSSPRPLPQAVGRSTPTGHRSADHSAPRVWASPGSLAATTGISADFLAHATEMFPFASRPSRKSLTSSVRRFPHSETGGSQDARLLPTPYRGRAPSFLGLPAPGHSSSAVCLFAHPHALARARSRWEEHGTHPSSSVKAARHGQDRSFSTTRFTW